MNTDAGRSFDYFNFPTDTKGILIVPVTLECYEITVCSSKALRIVAGTES